MDGASDAVKVAAQHSWEAATLVVIIVGICIVFAWLLKHWITQATELQKSQNDQACKREEALSVRVTRLEDFVETTLMTTVSAAQQVMKECTTTLSELQITMQHTRPCLWAGDAQRQHIQLVADLLAERLIMLIDKRGNDKKQNQA